MTALPSYVLLNDPSSSSSSGVLTTPAKPLSFPLSDEDKESIRILTAKYEAETNCSGLAAPQIGIGKQIIIFAVENGPDLKKWRPDLDQTMPKTLWINPSYTPLGTEQHIDYEGCFSVHDLAGPVPRFKTIQYTAYTPKGEHVEGVAEGFLARVIQHEVDHIRGRCFVHYVPEDQLFSIEHYRKKRHQAMTSPDIKEE